MNDTLQSGFRIGDWEVYPQENLLKGPDRARVLEPKVMDVLVFLAERQGEVVSRQQILDAVWLEVVVGDEVVSRAVSLLRTELGDDQKNPRYLKTISKRGYCFIAGVIPLASQRPQEAESDMDASASATPERPSESITHFTMRKPDFMIITVLVLALGYFAYDRFLLQPESGEVFGDIGRSIAVLPFENLGSAEDEYFAAGMTEEITSRLSEVSGLRVIANASARQYAGTDKTARQIGEELGADYLLTGSVRWSGGTAESSRIRITPSLVSSVDDRQMWAVSYERQFVNVFEIQKDVARNVISRLGITLRDSEQIAMVAEPTNDLKAYIHYLRAGDPDGVTIYGEEGLKQRTEQALHAVRLDPDFVNAWLRLGFLHSVAYSWGYDRSEARRKQAWQAVQRVVELAPDSLLAHVALGGYYFSVERNYERALEEYSAAEQANPNNPSAIAGQAWVLRRQGRFDAAVPKLRLALMLDPQSAGLRQSLCTTYIYLRRYPDAISCFDLVLEMQPTEFGPHLSKAVIYWSWTGDLTAARAELEIAAAWRDRSRFDHLKFWQLVFEEDYVGAVDDLSASTEAYLGKPTYFRPKELLIGFAYRQLGEDEAARPMLQLAVQLLELELEKLPDDDSLHSALGVAYAALGRTEEAIREGKRATEITPISKHRYFGLVHVEDLAWIYTLVGEHERALAELETLLSMPSTMTIPLVELDPRWAPLRGHPKYRELKDRFGEPDSVAGE